MAKKQPQKIGKGRRKEVNDPLESIYKEAILSLDAKPPKPEPVFGIADRRNGDIFVGTKGNISLFKGSKKARKTFAISAVTAAIVGNKEVISFKSMLGRKGRVLYVDTEQGHYDCFKVLEREFLMSGVKKEDVHKHLIFLTLRGHNPTTRKEVIDYAIKKLHNSIDIVIIDGIRDLITDINSSEESTEIVTELMKWSGNYNLHVLSVLHENKSNSNSRGHIGTELENKSESVVRIVKAENDSNYSAIEAESMRGHSFDPYLFTIDDDGFPELADETVNIEDVHTPNKDGKSKRSAVKGFQFEDLENHEHSQIISACYINEQGMFDEVSALSSRKLRERLKAAFIEKNHKIGDHKVRDFIEKYLDMGLLKDVSREGDRVKKMVPGVDSDLPF